PHRLAAGGALRPWPPAPRAGPPPPAAHHSARRDLTATNLELRFEQHYKLGSGCTPTQGRQDLLETDERNIDCDERHRFRKGVEISGVHTLHEHHARTLTKAPMEEPTPNIDGVNAGCSALQQHVGEAPGR